MKLSKNVALLNLILLHNKKRDYQTYFDIENWHWKSNFGDFWSNLLKLKTKKCFVRWFFFGKNLHFSGCVKVRSKIEVTLILSSLYYQVYGMYSVDRQWRLGKYILYMYHFIVLGDIYPFIAEHDKEVYISQKDILCGPSMTSCKIYTLFWISIPFIVLCSKKI